MRIKQIMLDKYHKMKSDKYKKIVFSLMQDNDFKPINNIRPKHIDTICFVLKEILPYRGGITSVLRLGTGLSKKGYQVFYSVIASDPISSLDDAAKKNLMNYSGQIIKYKRDQNYDVVIATAMETVSYAKKLNGYKMYFVQDYEPLFFAYGDLYTLAQNSYEQGFHMVSLGQWNAEMVKRECNVCSPIDVVDFPYEPSEYTRVERNFEAYKSKQDFTMAVYIKVNSRRMPYILQYVLTELKNKLKVRDHINLKIYYFGEDTWFECMEGTNLGRLAKDELCDLYHKTDFGAVISLTNISLVPYEMIATGLPVLEYKKGSFSTFFDEESAILFGLDSEELYNKILFMIKHPQNLEKMTHHAQTYLNNQTWSKTITQFDDIIKKLPMAGTDINL
ncbi:MAG: glycosyltransferase family 4 protein [Lachnospiraceae bacterium]|nr:glycosyltransferase family 4 protein [Lachnospiraceae bacterium]